MQLKTNDEQQLPQAQQADNVLYYTNTAIPTYLVIILSKNNVWIDT